MGVVVSWTCHCSHRYEAGDARAVLLDVLTHVCYEFPVGRAA